MNPPRGGRMSAYGCTAAQTVAVAPANIKAE
jgi:hypothetical protein